MLWKLFGATCGATTGVAAGSAAAPFLASAVGIISGPFAALTVPLTLSVTPFIIGAAGASVGWHRPEAGVMGVCGVVADIPIPPSTEA